MTGGRPLAEWTDTLPPVPDMHGAKCAGIAGFTEAPVNEQLAVCWGGTRCPVLDRCKALGMTAALPAKDEMIVYGGMRPQDRLAEMREARRQNRAKGKR